MIHLLRICGLLQHWKSFLEAVPFESHLDEILPIERDLGGFELIWYYVQLTRWGPSALDIEDKQSQFFKS